VSSWPTIGKQQSLPCFLGKHPLPKTTVRRRHKALVRRTEGRETNALCAIIPTEYGRKTNAHIFLTQNWREGEIICICVSLSTVCEERKHRFVSPSSLFNYNQRFQTWCAAGPGLASNETKLASRGRIPHIKQPEQVGARPLFSRPSCLPDVRLIMFNILQ
jgi:hypothetical protein